MALVKTVNDSEGFKVYVDGVLRLLVNASGINMPGFGGGIGVEVTPAGTIIDSVNFLPHTHGGVQTGGSNTAAVNP